MSFEQTNKRSEENLEIYLKGKTDEELTSMVEDPLNVLTTDDGSGEARPTDGFEMEEIAQRASSELESRRN
jgi:hypothetical protein